MTGVGAENTALGSKHWAEIGGRVVWLRYESSGGLGLVSSGGELWPQLAGRSPVLHGRGYPKYWSLGVEKLSSHGAAA